MTDNRGTANKERLVEKHTPSKCKSGSKSDAFGGFSGRIGKVLAFMRKLGRRSGTKRLYPTENQDDLWIGRKRRYDRCVVAVCEEIVIVKKMYELSTGQAPSNISYNARDATGGGGVFQIGYAGVRDISNLFFSRSFSTVIDDKDLGAFSLPNHALNRFSQFARPPKSRDDNRKIY